MLAFQRGEDAAFERLVEEYQGPLFGILRRILGPRAQLEDVAQEVFIRVWRSRERYRPEGKFSTYLYRIAYNLALNRIRDEGRRPLAPLAAAGEGPLPDPPDPRPAPVGDALDRATWSARILAALQRLPENQRAALVFQHYEGLDLIQIGAVLEISPQAAKSLLHRARETLRHLLQADWNSDQ